MGTGRRGRGTTENLAKHVQSKVIDPGTKMREKLDRLLRERDEAFTTKMEASRKGRTAAAKGSQAIENENIHSRKAELFHSRQTAVGRLAATLNGLNLVFLMSAYSDLRRGDASIDAVVQAGTATMETVASMRHLSVVSSQGETYQRLHRWGNRITAFEAVYFLGKSGFEFFAEEDPGKGVGDLISAAGAGILASTLFGGTAAAVVGVGLFLLGQFMAALFGDTELEEWFKECVWANEGYDGYLSSAEFESPILEQELNRLFEILLRPRVQGLSPYFCVKAPAR